MKINNLKESFQKKYGTYSEHIYFSPGRVNLIGEHTDYNGGVVFPCALSFGTYCLIRKTNNPFFRFTSLNQEQEYQIPLDELSIPLPKGNWTNYTIGVIAQFLKAGSKINTGADLLFWGDVPSGAGLSSSASLEMATAVAINDIFQLGHNQLELVKFSQKAEHEFAGVKCGIMDQFASGMGKKNHAIYLDCDRLDYEHVPIEMHDHKIIIANTNSPHSLDAGMYNQRVAECEKAVQELNTTKEIRNLGEISLSEFDLLIKNISEGTILKRARHVVKEIDRTRQAVKVLKEGNLDAFGKLMNESHDSLRDDYEVTGMHLDTMVEAARKVRGTIGARMTGGGFGGSTVNLVKQKFVDQFIEEVGQEYLDKTGIKAQFYVAEIGDGGRKLE